MRDVSIIGVGQTPVGEHWGISLRELALRAMQAALDEAGTTQVETLIVGNMLAQELSGQGHLGSLLADFAGLRGIEAVRVEAADASGGAALRYGYLAVAGGAVNTALVLGVEKFTDVVGSQRIAASTTLLDADYEATQGLTSAAQAALLMRRYMYEYHVNTSAFAGFSVNAHANSTTNPNAMYRNRITPEAFTKAPAIAPPVSLLDAAPEGDGAAALILTTTERARELATRPVRIKASAVATDALSLHDRPDPLFLTVASVSARKAYEQANIEPNDIDLFELHDSFTILTALTLEACGFAERGTGYQLACEEGVGLKGKMPIATFGGLKARGHAGGATGVYQAVEATLQLRGQAGPNQVQGARLAMLQNIGGLGGTAVTHIFEAVD
jgi:acetyl-CoA C-acetyltransferase